MSTNVKESKNFAKMSVCEIIKENIHCNNTCHLNSSQGYYHYAIVLPSRQNSGWCEKVVYRN